MKYRLRSAAHVDFENRTVAVHIVGAAAVGRPKEKPGDIGIESQRTSPRAGAVVGSRAAKRVNLRIAGAVRLDLEHGPKAGLLCFSPAVRGPIQIRCNIGQASAGFFTIVIAVGEAVQSAVTGAVSVGPDPEHRAPAVRTSVD